MIYRIINFLVKAIIASAVSIAVLPSFPGIAYGDNPEIIFSGFPPEGEQYYTALIECSELDGKLGEEIIITDDYGSYQILSWDREHKMLRERWVSDPVFERFPAKKIFIPSLFHDDQESYFAFINKQNEISVFKWFRYLVTYSEMANLESFKGSDSLIDCAIGRFRSKSKHWEYISLHGIKSRIFNKPPATILSYGNLDSEFHVSSSIILGYYHPGLSLTLVNHGFDKPQSVLFTVPRSGNRKTISFLHSAYPFKTAKFYRYKSKESVLQSGWAGAIDKTSILYLTFMSKDTANNHYINFLRIDEKPSVPLKIQIPQNTSKWVLGDLDGNGIRELIILDFSGKLQIYDISETLFESANF
jgi:hypothetical protein